MSKDVHLEDPAQGLFTCHLSLRFHVVLEVWLDESHPLFDAALNVSPSFTDVTDDLRGLSIHQQSAFARRLIKTYFVGLGKHLHPLHKRF